MFRENSDKYKLSEKAKKRIFREIKKEKSYRGGKKRMEKREYKKETVFSGHENGTDQNKKKNQENSRT